MSLPSNLRVALRHLEATDPLDGMPRRKVLALVNDVLDRAPTKGVFRDEYWQGVQAIWKTLTRAGIPFQIAQSRYEHENGVPVRKVWVFEIPFQNDSGRQDVVYGRVVAAGAGSVADPLSAYDIVAYAS